MRPLNPTVGTPLPDSVLSTLFLFMWSHIVGYAEGRIVEHTLAKVCDEATSILDNITLSLITIAWGIAMPCATVNHWPLHGASNDESMTLLWGPKRTLSRQTLGARGA